MHKLAFMRHGERRRGESDPALTSGGRRMAREAALWLESAGFVPTRIVATPTQRTHDTREEVSLVFPSALLADHPGASPELEEDLEALLADLTPEDTLLVGHHPTLAFLLRAFGPAPMDVPHHHFAATLLLEAGPEGRWRVSAAWPGRPGS